MSLLGRATEKRRAGVNVMLTSDHEAVRSGQGGLPGRVIDRLRR
jgi:hypothetical protein